MKYVPKYKTDVVMKDKKFSDHNTPLHLYNCHCPICRSYWNNYKKRKRLIYRELQETGVSRLGWLSQFSKTNVYSNKVSRVKDGE